MQELQKMSLLKMVMAVMATFPVVHCYRILFIPSPDTSNCLEIMSIGREMLMAGHHVTLYLPLTEDPTLCVSAIWPEATNANLSIIMPRLDPKFQNVHNDISGFLSKDRFGLVNNMALRIKYTKPWVLNLCGSILQDRRVVEEFEEADFDMSVVSVTPYTGCLLSLPVHLGIPSCAILSEGHFDEPMPPLHTAGLHDMSKSYKSQMTLFQRLLNACSFYFGPLMAYLLIPSIDMSQYSDKLHDFDSRNAMDNSAILMENSEFILDDSIEMLPDLFQVGGLTTSLMPPLTDDMESIMDGASNGVILVTFGNIIKELPKDYVDKITSILKLLDYQVLFKQNENSVDGNVRSYKWLHQNSILSHKSTKLFISHCNKNDFWEAVFNGVPIICLPMNAESLKTIVQVDKYQIGSSVDIFDDSIDDIVREIKAVLRNVTIHKNIKKLSMLLKDRPETSAHRAASTIERIIKHGASHIKHTGFLSNMYTDVWLTLFLFTISICVCIYWICKKNAHRHRKHETHDN